MSNLNKIQLIGHLGHDPEVRAMPSGESVANVSLAVTETWKDKAGAKQERTTWFRVAFFGRLAEIAEQYLTKGALIYVEGSVSARAYQSRSGEAAASLEVRARELKMLSGRQKEGEESPAAAPAPAATPAQVEFDDDIPF